MLVLEKITKSFLLKGGVRRYIFRNLNLTIPKLNLAILGKNGAGKSTLIKVLTGIESIDSGEVYLNGEKIIALFHQMRTILLVQYKIMTLFILT